MQAAFVSLLMVAGAVGAQPDAGDWSDPPAVVDQGYGDAAIGRPDCGRQSPDYNANSWRRFSYDEDQNAPQGPRLWSPVTPNGVVTYRRGPLGLAYYSPLWLIHSQQTFYPANYAKPYDYREAFGYPWNGPRPLPPLPPGPP